MKMKASSTFSFLVANKGVAKGMAGHGRRC